MFLIIIFLLQSTPIFQILQLLELHHWTNLYTTQPMKWIPYIKSRIFKIFLLTFHQDPTALNFIHTLEMIIIHTYHLRITSFYLSKTTCSNPIVFTNKQKTYFPALFQYTTNREILSNTLKPSTLTKYYSLLQPLPPIISSRKSSENSNIQRTH
jgi:hypothetical protein